MSKISFFGQIIKVLVIGKTRIYTSPAFWTPAEFIISFISDQGNIPGCRRRFIEIRIFLVFIGSTDNYYEQALVKYNGTLEQLITQKWLGLFLTGAEGWFDHRRTGYPVFTLGPAAAQKTIPLRYIYPDEERATNDASYKAAIALQGIDDSNTKMWYLK